MTYKREFIAGRKLPRFPRNKVDVPRRREPEGKILIAQQRETPLTDLIGCLNKRSASLVAAGGKVRLVISDMASPDGTPGFGSQLSEPSPPPVFLNTPDSFFGQHKRRFAADDAQESTPRARSPIKNHRYVTCDRSIPLPAQNRPLRSPGWGMPVRSKGFLPLRRRNHRRLLPLGIDNPQHQEQHDRVANC